MNTITSISIREQLQQTEIGRAVGLEVIPHRVQIGLKDGSVRDGGILWVYFEKDALAFTPSDILGNVPPMGDEEAIKFDDIARITPFIRRK